MLEIERPTIAGLLSHAAATCRVGALCDLSSSAGYAEAATSADGLCAVWQGAAPVGSGTISATAAALRTAIDAADYVMHIEMLPGGGAPYAAAELIGPNKYREFGGLLGILASHCGQWELLLAVLERAGASPRLVT